MISYELAKQLKDAGFLGSENWTLEGDVIVRPTLSELINVCGNEHFVLFSMPAEEDKSKRWKLKCMMKQWAGTTFGKTPEDAVANAWLTMNKSE